MLTTPNFRLQILPIVFVFLPLINISAISQAQAVPAPAPAAQAQAVPTQPAPPLPPLSANLTMPVDASSAKIGTHVHARVTAPWSGNGCALRLGALVEGHVSQVERRSKTDQKSAIHLVFDSAECNHQHPIPLKATLIALLGPPDAPSGMGKAPPLTDVPLPIGMRSVEAASAANRNFVSEHNTPTRWVQGMVVDVPMNLTVGGGAEGGSIIWTEKNDARLEAQTTLILMVAP